MVMTYSKPTVRNAWADTAVVTTDIVDPGNAIVTAGWLQNTIPPVRQYFNWVLNWGAAGVRYFMQRGVVDWDIAETYQINATVLWNGTLYQSLINNNTGNTPQVNFAGTSWGPLNSYAYYLSGATTGGNFNLRNYVLTTVLTSTLASYVTQTSLTSQLSAYVTNTSLASQLASYSTIAFLEGNFYNTTQIGTLLANYLTTASAATTYATKISPTLSGTPTTPTAANGTSTTQIASTAFAVGAVSAAAAGFQRLPSGILLQWGITAAGSGAPQAVSFPTAFTTECYSITANSIAVNGTINVSNPHSSNTGFTVTNGASGATTSWFAIGK